MTTPLARGSEETEMDLGITGRTALITGADSGIGWETARILLAEGATVILSDQDQATLDEAAACTRSRPTSRAWTRSPSCTGRCRRR
jgi:NAD(P)-dependent dehydrogenase (short-subunit alcohol dehydrogenase family)